VKKSASLLVLMLFLSLFLISVPQIDMVKAESVTHIYINADRSVEGTDKIQRDGNVYTLTDNIDRSDIMVLKDDVVLDGAGYSLTGGPSGILLAYRDNVMIKNFVISIKGFTGKCIWLYYCSNCVILNNTMESDYSCSGIDVGGGDSNFFAGNHVMYMAGAIGLGEGTSDNVIFGNTLTNNSQSIGIVNSQNNTVYYNNFVNNNYIHIMTQLGSISFVNYLDNSTVGNYWSDYNETDNDGDGIGDTPHIVKENVQDNYPLMNPVDIAGIPEFPSWVILPLLLFMVIFIVIIKKEAIVYVRKKGQ
jgi:parallel beta-helix repeat protein